MRAELHLPRRVRREYFIKPKIQLFVAEFCDYGWQVNRPAIADARFDRHRCKRHNFNTPTGQTFHV